MTTYASKTPRDLNHDPHPWAVYVWPHQPRINASMRYATKDEAERQAFGSYVHGFYPRPEFDHVQHNEPNPILMAFRRYAAEMKRERGWTVAMTALSWDRDAFDPFVDMYDLATLAHARRVLERLANLSRIGA